MIIQHLKKKNTQIVSRLKEAVCQSWVALHGTQQTISQWLLTQINCWSPSGKTLLTRCLSTCCCCWRHSLMLFHVLFAVNRGSECFITKWALIWFHAHVSCHMSSKTSISSEWCIANATAECFNSWNKIIKKYKDFLLSNLPTLRKY